MPVYIPDVKFLSNIQFFDTEIFGERGLASN
jgi:hypothetical protein